MLFPVEITLSPNYSKEFFQAEQQQQQQKKQIQKVT